MQQEFYSNGKLLLSGEYAVLDGAEAWAIPTKSGQFLRIQPAQQKKIIWKSLNEKDECWFEGIFDSQTLAIFSSSSAKIAKRLKEILQQAKKLNPNFLKDREGLEISTKLTFPKDWGLGSSSTLINNIAQWAQVNAHQLLWSTMGGSGYDISCAQYDHPILYELKEDSPKVTKVEFPDSFRENIFFIYLNKKQDSRKAISEYQKNDFDKQDFITKVSELTNEMVGSQNLIQFESFMTAHEELLSEVLKISPVKQRLFNDYFGGIKSLGAWGGDFIMATGTQEKTPGYFKSKGFQTIVSFKEMAL